MLMATSSVHEAITAAVVHHFPKHPFSHGVTGDNLEIVLRNFLAMSQAFPFLQAGSQKDLIFSCIQNNVDVPAELERTTVVANFLCWDEVGGHNVVRKHGNPGLPLILETDRRFHSNLLRQDMRRIFDRDVGPDYSPVTRTYLTDLFDGLAATDAVRRCATMVAFELHAGTMIEALWDSVSAITGQSRDTLIYFLVHVGGDDPAEPYHIAMTERLISDIVPPGTMDTFIDYLLSAYRLNANWCEALKRM